MSTDEPEDPMTDVMLAFANARRGQVDAFEDRYAGDN